MIFLSQFRASNIAALGGAISYSAAATQFFSRISDPGPSYKSAYATLIDALVSGGIWSVLDGLYVAGPDQSTFLVNLKQSSYGGTVSGSGTYLANEGWAGNGSTGRVSTGFNPTTASGNYTQNSAHLGVWQFNSQYKKNQAHGFESAATLSHVFPQYTDGNAYWRINDASGGASSGQSGVHAAGFFLANRSGASASQSYRNGASVASPNTTSAALPNRNIIFGASDANGAIGSFSNKMVRAFSWGGSLTSGQQLAFYNALNTYFTAIFPLSFEMACFSKSSSNLFFSTSLNGSEFADQAAAYTKTPDAAVRDTSMLKVGSIRYVFYTNVANLGDATSTFSYAKSTDGGATWARVGTVQCSAVTGGAGTGRVWAPEPFVDGNGDIYMFFSYDTDTTGTNFQFGAVKCTDLNANTWNAAVSVTGSAIPSGAIDPMVILKGGTYYLWYKNEATAYIEVVSSSSPTSGYNTAFGAGDWMGLGSGVEGPCIVQISGNHWRLYVDAISNYDGVGIGYSDSYDDWSTWAGFGRIAQSAVSDPAHGTIVKL